MNYLVVLAVFFGSGTVFVGADYYIEFREPTTAASSSNAQPETVTYLYECKIDPPGASAYTAAQSLCTEVTSLEVKFNIYINCNFFMVYRPNPRRHVIHLLGRGIMSHQTWYLGFLNHAMDHPNFAVPQEQDIDHSSAELDGIWSVTGLGPYIVNDLAFYYAQNNLISYSRNAAITNTLFCAFVSFLRRLTGRYFHISQESATNRLLYTSALKMGLQKMVDPCSVLHGDLRTSASNYCAVY